MSGGVEELCGVLPKLRVAHVASVRLHGRGERGPFGDDLLTMPPNEMRQSHPDLHGLAWTCSTLPTSAGEIKAAPGARLFEHLGTAERSYRRLVGRCRIRNASHVGLMSAPTRPVVIAEGDADFVAILRGGVRDAGYRPIWARDGREALSAIMDQQPAAVLCDIAILEMDGFDLLAALEGSPVLSRIPRVIVTRGATFATWYPTASPVADTQVGLTRLLKVIRRLAGPTVRLDASWNEGVADRPA